MCSSNPDLYADSLTQTCSAVCSGSQYTNNFNRLCVSSCSPLFQYSGKCVQLCPNGLYANTSGDCIPVSSCPTTYYGENSTTQCVVNCITGFADSNSGYCIAVCPNSWYGDNTHKVCTQSCPPGTT
jgi:hypothetical protein